MHGSRLECFLYYFMQDGTLKGLNAAHADDLFRAGDSDFITTANCTNIRFKMSDAFSFPNEFTGFRLDQLTDGGFMIDQTNLLQKLQWPSISANFSQIRSVRMKLVWLSKFSPRFLPLHRATRVDHEINAGWTTAWNNTPLRQGDQVSCHKSSWLQNSRPW